MNIALPFATALLACTLVTAAAAEPLVVGADATMEKLLAGQAGKVVTLKLSGTEELTGKVKTVSSEVVHLSELSGKEFFDAVVATDSITAVVIRTR